ncbi:hypothetical protein A3I35_04095 [Candidatus Falkowbacteria bacterium RIFCSPLOWO2_02_FULL_45_15]|uniref:Uncharacterized protein n=1 Tax=Candidatus Falkowbacteria bacterium RIFCSPLOWO2_02_FULL_45_15 TaxID=1797988 RepID=A0A1F5RWB7_9BACT|nr:MAG: hypothetical protein A3I35_04095 [Candidatus Falkowbacteria bacterium RIFCSPLOWO2_02_FULL_45_15]
MNFSWLTNLNRLIVRRRTRLFWALTSVIIASLAILVIYPALREIKTTAAEITKLKNQLERRQAPEYALKDILASYRQHEVKLGSLNRAVMNKSRELEFITALEDIAARYGLQQKIVIGNYQALPNNAFSQMPLQLQLTGNFKDELRYLQGLERLPFYVNVKQISLNSIAAPPMPSNADAVAATAENLVNLVITADTFWQ